MVFSYDCRPNMCCLLFWLVLWIADPRNLAHACTKPYTPLHDIPSRVHDNVYSQGKILVNDYNIEAKWYSTVFNGKQYYLADRSHKVDVGSCGTYYPVYLKDGHPDVASITATATTVTVCLKSSTVVDCDTTYNIEIRKCGDEIQYRLESTRRYSAFCLVAGQVLDPSQLPPPTNTFIDSVSVVPNLTFTDAYILSSKRTEPSFNFICDIDQWTQGWFYEVSWYVDGHIHSTFGPSNITEDLYLKESKIGVRLGMTMQCSVKVSEFLESQQSESYISDEFFAGIKIQNRTVFVDKINKETEIELKLTIPIGCGYHDDDTSSCSTKIFMNTNNASKGECEGSITDLSTNDAPCNTSIPLQHRGSTFDPDQIYRMSIVSTDMSYDDSLEFNINLQLRTDMDHKIWRQFVLPIRVIVIENDFIKNRLCYSHVDPHMQTADGLTYEQQRSGEYLMYHNEEYGIEVQEKLRPCSHSGRPYCACGIAIRAGKDVFMINRCGKVNFIDFTTCGEGGILEVVAIDSHLYRVYTPIGTRIEIRIIQRPWLHYRGLLNIDIFLAPKDFNKISGLCGTFDGDRSNDLLHSDTQTLTSSGTRHPNAFSESWRLDKGSFTDINLFRHANRSLESWKETNNIYCICGTDNVKCSATQYLSCNITNSITPKKCRVDDPFRRKRSVGQNTMELERLLSLMQADLGADHYAEKRQDDTITADEAEQMCADTLNNIPAVTDYPELIKAINVSNIISECQYDVDFNDDANWIQIHVDAINTIARTTLDLRPHYKSNNLTNLETFFKNTCHGNCSDRGKCTTEGECLCDQFYHGADCTLDERDVILIGDVHGGGECDIADGGECRCFKIRTDTELIDGFRCTISTYQVRSDGSKLFVNRTTSFGQFEDIYTGVCCSESGQAVGAFGINYEISASNDGVSEGMPEHMYVYDSDCQVVEWQDKVSGQAVIRIDDARGCYISSRCVLKGEFSSVNPCFYCNPSTNIYTWTVDNGNPSCIGVTAPTVPSTALPPLSTEGQSTRNPGLDPDLPTTSAKLPHTEEPELTFISQNTWVVIAAPVAGVVIIFGIALLCVCTCKRSKRQKASKYGETPYTGQHNERNISNAANSMDEEHEKSPKQFAKSNGGGFLQFNPNN